VIPVNPGHAGRTLFGETVYYRKDISVFPNPTSEQIEILLPEDFDQGQLIIRDNNGQNHYFQEIQRKTDQKTIDKVNRLVALLIKYQGEAKIYRSNYTDLMNLIGLVSQQSYKINLMRRSFYRIANSIGKRDYYPGLSNGDNLGQVASQTMESIDTISCQVDMPIYRPVLTRDKIETIEKAKEIGTFDISIEQASEACELFAPKAPTTKPTRSTAEKLEKELSNIFDMEEKNIKNIEIINVSID